MAICIYMHCIYIYNCVYIYIYVHLIYAYGPKSWYRHDVTMSYSTKGQLGCHWPRHEAPRILRFIYI